jgi:hypothetical protein
MASDLRFALRMILTHRWFSAAVLATLALGIGLNNVLYAGKRVAVQARTRAARPLWILSSPFATNEASTEIGH